MRHLSQIAKEINTSQEKLWKNPKYTETEAKFLKTTNVNTLNYQKRVDKKAHEERKLKEEAKRKQEKDLVQYNHSKFNEKFKPSGTL